MKPTKTRPTVVRSPTPAQVRAARLAAELTQTAAAALIHCSLRGWQDWESGERTMHPAFWELWGIKQRAR